MEKYLVNYYEITAMILFGIGMMTLLLNKNIIKKLVGLNIMDSSVLLFLVARGYIEGRVAPIISDVNNIVVSDYINPVPSGLALTGIVVGISVTAFSLAIVVNLYRKYRTLDVDEIAARAKGEDN